MAKAQQKNKQIVSETASADATVEIQEMSGRIAELSNDMSRCEAEVERLIAAIREVPQRIKLAKQAHQQAFDAADEDAITAAKDEIKKANADRATAIETLATMVDPIQDLQAQHSALREETLTALVAAKEAAEQARLNWAKTSMEMDTISAVGGKVASLRAAVREFETREPAKPTPQAAPVTPAPRTKPSCPRCRRPDDVRFLSAGRWTCNRVHHGRLVFDDKGVEIEGRKAKPPIQSESMIRTAY